MGVFKTSGSFPIEFSTPTSMPNLRKPHLQTVKFDIYATKKFKLRGETLKTE
jgi:hypothetical protein